MKSKREILLAHYTELIKRAATWTGVAALLSMTLVAAPASALGAQMGTRYVTPAKSAAGATNTYTVSFTPGTTNQVGSVLFELCDSPLESVACANSTTPDTNSYGDSFATSVVTVGGTGWTGGTWTTGAKTGPAGGAGTGVSVKVANSGTSNSPTTAQPAAVSITNVVNPTGNNQKYYLRVTTYSSITYTGEVDFGAMALQTAQDLTVSANVQEQLTFCTGITTAAACGSVGAAAIPLGTGSGCPILSTSNVCTGTSQMTASTNAQGGYSISYVGSTLTNTGATDTITETGTPGAVSTPASKQFGLAITAQTGSGTKVAVYDFVASSSKYAFVSGSTPQQIATGTAANGEATYTVTYAANVSSVTKAGTYNSVFSYICTGTF